MPSAKVTSCQSNLNGGEISPESLGRFDIAKYANCLKRMENFLPMQLGGAKFRPGTRYVGEVKDSSARTRLIPFQFNTEQAYLLELGNLYMRFWANRGQVVVNPSTPIDSYTKLLSHFDGADLDAAYTAETGQNFSFFGDAKTLIDQKKFGTSSLKLDGSGDYVTLPDSDDWNFGSGNFTIDMWVRFDDATVTNQSVFSQLNSGSDYVNLAWNESANGAWTLTVVGLVTVTAADTLSSNTWYHLALVRNGNDWVIYRDGVSKGTTTQAGTYGDYSAVICFGTLLGYGHYFKGYMDEVRVSKGIARWTTGFTPYTYQYGGAADWVTSTAYVVGDYVNSSSTTYLCLVAHTSGTFATDLAAGKWTAQTALEVVTPYALADVPNIHVTQNADTMYFFHQDYPVYKLQRVSATEFTFTIVAFKRGPFLDDNITATTITPSAATGTGITLTASTAIFQAGHVGSYWKVNTGVVKITAFTSTTVVTGDVQAEPSGVAGTLTGTSAYTSWAEGAFSTVRGYPATGVFYGQRLVMGGTSYQPQHFYATYIRAFENFKVDASDASAAYTYQVSSEEVNAIRWLASAPGALQFGTSGGSLSGRVTTGTITNVNPPEINADSNYGALPIQPQKISSYLYYVQKNGFNIRELVYNYLTQRNTAGDMNLMAEHILRDGGGATEIDHSLSPQDMIWVTRSDGQIAVLLRNAEQEIMGWCRIVAGADSTSDGMFESLAIIHTDNGDDEIWVICKRTVGGATQRYVEYFTPEKFDDDWDSINLDCSLTLDSPITITGATKANPVVITAPSHGFSNGDQVKIDNVLGMTDLNGNSYLIANKTTNTFELQSLASVNVDGTAYGTYLSGGEVRKMVTAITGLSHLEGQAVHVQADGVALSSTYTVSSGSITLASKAAVVHAGLFYDGQLTLLKAGDMNSQFKNRRFYLSSLRVNRSLGFKIGQDADTLTEQVISTADGAVDPNDGILYTGDLPISFTSWWSKDAEPVIKQDSPNPLHILCVQLMSEVIEKD